MEDMTKDKNLAILGCVEAMLKENGFRTELVRQNGGHPAILRLEHPRTGKIMQDILIEMCFIPMKMPTEGMGLMQFYTTLFTGLHPEFEAEVRRTCEYCNDYSALGAFGYFTPAHQLYLRHNTIVDTRGEFGPIVTIIAENISLVLASVERFIDAFASISTGVMDMRAAIEQELLPRL